MSIPALPNFYDMVWVKEDGRLSVDASLFCDETFQTLNQVVTLLNLISIARVINDGTVNRNTVINDGLTAPSKSSAEIVTLSNDTTVPDGTIWYDTTVSKLKFKVGTGSTETITST